MARLTINGIVIEAPDGVSVLDAARQAGIDVPALCYLKETGALTTCMICLVKELPGGRMLAACSTRADDGMRIDTESEDVRAARREILTMLLSEHVGDCEAPCTRICPASLDIPRMLRYVAAGDTESAARVAQRDLIFPATLGQICTAPCERGCRRATFDNCIAIKQLHRGASFQPAESSDIATRQAGSPPHEVRRFAVVGAGLSGLAAAWTLLVEGHACRVYEKRDTACSALRAHYADELPQDVLDAEIERIVRLGAEFVYGREAGVDFSLGSLAEEHEAVIVACDISHPESAKFFKASEDAMPVRSVSHGKSAARHAMRLAASDKPPKHFNSQIGRLNASEMKAYAEERLTASESGDSRSEAARCLHCDCLKPVSCKLRRYAEEYGVDHHVKRHMPRPPVQAIQRGGDVLFEAGKCIKCGICIEIVRAAGVRSGITFAGRGLASHVRAPLGGPFEAGLGSTALRCVEACPTGALALRTAEERS
jgi:ferredoxin